MFSVNKKIEIVGITKKDNICGPVRVIEAVNCIKERLNKILYLMCRRKLTVTGMLSLFTTMIPDDLALPRPSVAREHHVLVSTASLSSPFSFFFFLTGLQTVSGFLKNAKGLQCSLSYQGNQKMQPVQSVFNQTMCGCQ